MTRINSKTLGLTYKSMELLLALHGYFWSLTGEFYVRQVVDQRPTEAGGAGRHRHCRQQV